MIDTRDTTNTPILLERCNHFGSEDSQSTHPQSSRTTKATFRPKLGQSKHQLHPVHDGGSSWYGLRSSKHGDSATFHRASCH